MTLRDCAPRPLSPLQPCSFRLLCLCESIPPYGSRRRTFATYNDAPPPPRLPPRTLNVFSLLRFSSARRDTFWCRQKWCFAHKTPVMQQEGSGWLLSVLRCGVLILQDQTHRNRRSRVALKRRLWESAWWMTKSAREKKKKKERSTQPAPVYFLPLTGKSGDKQFLWLEQDVVERVGVYCNRERMMAQSVLSLKTRLSQGNRSFSQQPFWIEVKGERKRKESACWVRACRLRGNTLSRKMKLNPNIFVLVVVVVVALVSTGYFMSIWFAVIKVYSACHE